MTPAIGRAAAAHGAHALDETPYDLHLQPLANRPGVADHVPAVIPATSARMAFRRSAIWRSSLIDSSRFVTGAESYGWSRLTSLANVLSSPLLFCSW
jgi:hypothetical protein